MHDAVAVIWMPGAEEPRIRRLRHDTAKAAGKGSILGGLVGLVVLGPVGRRGCGCCGRRRRAPAPAASGSTTTWSIRSGSELTARHVRPARAQQRRRRRQAPAAPGTTRGDADPCRAERGRARRAASSCSRRPESNPSPLPRPCARSRLRQRRPCDARAGEGRPSGRREHEDGTGARRAPAGTAYDRGARARRSKPSARYLFVERPGCGGSSTRSAPRRSARSWRPPAAGRPPPPGLVRARSWRPGSTVPTGVRRRRRRRARGACSSSMPRDRHRPSWSSTTPTGYRCDGVELLRAHLTRPPTPRGCCC